MFGDSAITLDDKAKVEKSLDNLDSILAQELNQLSFKERSAIYEEIHSVDTVIEETPELLQTSFEKLEDELSKIKVKPAYEQAERISPEYVRGYKLRIMFLRSECFNAGKAARRLVAFFEGKLKLFGEAALTRSIFQSDLDKDDITALRSGVFQVFSTRDRSGRLVGGNFHKLIKGQFYKRPENMMKTFFYWAMNLVEYDEETQRRGFVGIMYMVSDNKMEFDFNLHTRMPQLIDWIPLRVLGLHICSNDNYVRGFKKLVMATMGKNLRVRLRIHDGTATETQYNLMSFGIPVESMPIGYEGELKTAAHVKWLSKLKQREVNIQCGQPFDGVDIPGINDVLCGRGKYFRDHPGTCQLRASVESYLGKYEKARRKDRLEIFDTILNQIKARRGRFLKRLKNDWWVPITDDAAREKIASTFRTMISTNKKVGKVILPSPSAPKTNAASTYHETEGNKRARLSEGSDSEASNCFSFCSVGGGI